jgi:N-glycosylase/DNA lyase
MRNQFSIDIDNSINSGQVFLWEKCGSDWYGINGQDILKINKNAVIKSIQNSKTDFFRKKDNMQEIIKSISKDKTVKKAIKQYAKNIQARSISMHDFFYYFIKFQYSKN